MSKVHDMGGREEKRVSSTAYATAAAAAAVILSPCQIMGIWSAREGILAGGKKMNPHPAPRFHNLHHLLLCQLAPRRALAT